ncbi:MAG: peptidase [Flaviaesturariibacter sp.]|nr:peptidase [Flaviaesturariibacter sp.]
MTNFIPIFPLSLVVYPGEPLNLHIFEPRYKQLIGECHREKRLFGIPAVIDNKMQDFGTLMEIIEVTNVHENGDLDIKTRGQKVFRILEVVREIPDRLYCGAIVNYPRNFESIRADIVEKLMVNVRELHQMLNVSKDFHKPDSDLTSYDLAHHVGLSMQEEYELLNLMDERQRMEYLRRHLARVLPTVAQMEGLKEKIRLNGHFKNLSGFTL